MIYSLFSKKKKELVGNMAGLQQVSHLQIVFETEKNCSPLPNKRKLKRQGRENQISLVENIPDSL